MNYTLEKFMDFTNPTEAFTGKREGIQGFAIHGDLGFMLFHTGVCAVYDLVKRDSEPLDVFKLGSYNRGEPDNRYTNHANDAMFSSLYFEDGDEFPLLYVTTGNSGDSDSDGYIGRCAVERIIRENGKFRAECVQEISFLSSGDYRKGFEAPAWGWPATLVDSERGELWLFSARIRTKIAFADRASENNYILTRFELPDQHSGKVVLRPCDIREQFTCEFDVFFTQGGTIHERELYYTFGGGNATYPDALRVYSLDEKRCIEKYDLSNSLLGREEVECIAPYDGSMLINTQAGKLYRFDKI